MPNTYWRSPKQGNRLHCTGSGFVQSRYAEYSPSHVSATLKAFGGDYGGGSETIVITETEPLCMATGQANAEIIMGGVSNIEHEP